MSRPKSLPTWRTRQRRSAALLSLVLAAGLSSPSAHADDDLKDKQRDVRKSLRGAKHELEESSRAASVASRRLSAARKQLGAARDRLATTRGQLAAAKALDEKMAAELTAAQAELTQARAELTLAREKVKAQRQDIGRLAVADYTENSPELLRLSVLFAGRDPSETTTQLEAVDSVAQKQERVLAELKAARTALAATEARVEEARDQVRIKREAARRNLAERVRLEAEAETAAEQVTVLVGTRRKASAVAAAARAADERELAKLRRENDRIAAMLRARAAKATGNYTGPLLRPVDGYVTSPYGYRRHPIYGYYGLHDGTDFHAPCGTGLRASGDGVVVSRYFNSVWGNRLILDLGRVNGKGVAVIYNHMSGYRVGAGDRVKRGEIVGYAGTTGWSTACHLHFTVMANGQPVDPMAWF